MPFGDSPNGNTATHCWSRRGLEFRTIVFVSPGQWPGETGGSPVLPRLARFVFRCRELRFEFFDGLLREVGGQRVGGDAGGAGDVEADGFAVQIQEWAAALPGFEDGVVLDETVYGPELLIMPQAKKVQPLVVNGIGSVSRVVVATGQKQIAPPMMAPTRSVPT